MRPMRRRSDLPNEDEVLAFQLYSVAHGLKLHPGLVDVVWVSEEANPDGEYIEREFIIERVEDNSAEMHPGLTLYLKETWSNARGGKGRNTSERQALRQQTSEADAEEHGEGTVQDQ